MADNHRQAYLPYRTSLLLPAELRRLSQLRPGRVVVDTLLLWAQIAIAWWMVASYPAWWVAALAIPVIGTRYYSLYILGHDGLHRRLFLRVGSNDLWNDLLIIGPIGAITRLNRANHMRHHGNLACPEDPDRYKYIAANKRTWSAYLLALTGLPYVASAVGNVFLHRQPAVAAGVVERYSVRDLLIIVGWQVALVGGLSLFVGWWAYPLLWLLPVYVFTYVADIVRVFLEHSVPGGDEAADETMRLVTYRSTLLERQFFAPMNMNFHAAHHLWPGIPYYHLPEADRLMRASERCDDGLVWRGSYVAYLLEFGQHLLGKQGRRKLRRAGWQTAEGS